MNVKTLTLAVAAALIVAGLGNAAPVGKVVAGDVAPPGKVIVVEQHTEGLIPSSLCGAAGCEFPYKTVAHYDPLINQFFSPTFNDSSWSTGTTPFADLNSQDPGYCSGLFIPNDHTLWPVNGDVLVRVKFPLCAGTSGLQVHVAIDNSVRLWFNGNWILEPAGSCPYAHSPEDLCDYEYCTDPSNRVIYTIPDAYLKTDGTANVLAIQACDHGVVSYLDFDVVANATPSPLDCDPCQQKSVSMQYLWPPNNKYTDYPVTVTVGGVLATITGVWQDELTKKNPGDECPDAQITGDGLGVYLRAQRDGGENGRIYHLNYQATVGSESCTGTIPVCVPHDMGPDPVCVDGGLLYDSTVCGGDD